MSAQAIGWVLDYSLAKGATRMVLIAIANHIDSENGEGWAYLSTVLAEANVSEDSYRRACQWLEDAGELERGVKEGGSLRVPNVRRPNLFRLPKFAATRPNATPAGRGGRTPAGRDPRTVRPSQDAGVRPLQAARVGPLQDAGDGSRALQEPSKEPSEQIVRPDVQRVIDHLRVRSVEYGNRPPKTDRWAKHIDLLLRRGSTEWEEPEPVPVDDVIAMVDFVFLHRNVRNSRGFCWADQIQSGESLRRHWVRLLQERDKPGSSSTTASNLDAVRAAKAAYVDNNIEPGSLFGVNGGGQ